MTNEFIFLIHIICVCTFLLAALSYGKEALIALITLYCVIANSFVMKQMSLCGLHATCTDAFMVGAVLGLNLLQEYYGKNATRKAIAISFVGACIYAFFGIIQLLYQPSSADTYHPHYQILLTPIPRIVITSLFVYLLAQIVDYYLFGSLKKLCKGRFLVVRIWLSTGITQFLDTVLFTVIGLYGIAHNLGELILISYAIKMLVLLSSTPFMWLSKKIIKTPA